MIEYLKYALNFWKGVLFGNSSSKIDNFIPKSEKSVELPAGIKIEPKSKEIMIAKVKPIFDPEMIITNERWLDASSMNENQIQEFLVSKGSFLKDYKINDHLTSYWMAKHCGDNGLSPQVILTHIQKEQGLISQKTLPTRQRRLDYALGVGATDGGDNSKWKGMDNQLLGAVLTCTKWFNYGEKNNAYPLKYRSSEKRNIMLKNSASFSLYKYCPWIGDQSMVINRVKYDAPFGNLLFWKVFTHWFG